MKVLDSVRVLEIGGLGPGPFCAMHLADLGADVISVVRKSQGDTPTGSLLNRGKRSVFADLKTEEGRQLVRVLSSGARLEWVYDELGRAVEAAVVSDDQRAVTTLAYEGDAPDPVRVTDATGGTTSMVWEQGLLKQVTDPTGVSVRLEHDEFGELVATTDALGNTARLERDAAAELDRHGWKTDYIAVRRQADLQAPSGGDEALVVLAASRLGQPRLIDNVEI